MDITYIFRTQSQQRSIERVFEPIIERMKASGHNVTVEFAVKKKSLLATLWSNMWHFRKVSQKQICHITGDVQYVACLMNPNNTILTIHDLIPLHNKNVPWYSKFLCYWLWYYIPLKRLNHITCISEATKRDLLTFFPWAEKKITVINNPVDDSFTFIPKEFNTECPRILHIGTKPNKNLSRVIEALAGIKCHLRIIGKLPDVEKELLQRYKIDYSNAFGISDAQIVEEYKQADIISFPSTFEGFGMPIIEGQTTGRIVVTSDREPMRSIAGSGAILVDPEDVQSIKEGFTSSISKEGMSVLLSHGKTNALKYSPNEILNKYLLQYNKLVSRC